MTVIEGQIETLKKLKDALNKSGISRFNSLGEIRRFISGFEAEKKQLPAQIECDLDKEVQRLTSELESHRKIYVGFSVEVRDEIKEKIKEIKEKIERVNNKGDTNALFKVVFSLKVWLLARKASRLERNLEKIVDKRTRKSKKLVAKAEVNLNNFVANRESLASQRLGASISELDRTREVVDGLYPLVSGAIGEAAVVRTLRELSDEYYLINDFSAKFNPPIYNKSRRDRIYSAQIDHLLVCRSGVFLLETKHWGQASVQSLDLRSPVEQIKRTSYAIFVVLNSESRKRKLRLKRHHWGEKKVPIRNIIVMTNEKPQEEFKYVKVLALDELIGYIKFFDEIFSPDEVRGIFEFLRGRAKRSSR